MSSISSTATFLSTKIFEWKIAVALIPFITNVGYTARFENRVDSAAGNLF